MLNTKRTENSIRNSMVAMIANVVSILIAFISQSIFIKILGAEYLGLNGLFTNVLTMLSIFELGIGSAIIYNLYEPIAHNKVEKIKSLMKFYKKSYNIIVATILVVGILIIPIIPKMVGEITIDINIYCIYLLFLLSTVASYLMAYKRNLIYANQKNYIVDLVHMTYLIILNIIQLLLLFLTKNYYIYLIIKIICQILENVILTQIANKMYPYLLDKDVQKIDKKVERDIFSKVKALLFHKIGGIVVNGTDNIIISYFFGVVTVGLYTNYYMIINAVKKLFSQIILSTSASIGNLLVTENNIKRFEIFKKIRFLNFWIACFSAISILLIIQPFIEVWVGTEYLLENIVVLVLIINFFQQMMRFTYSTFKESAGIYVEDKFIPLIESVLNIVFSIIFLKIFGLVGVFIGTIISGLVLWCYSYPKFVYKKLFNRKYIDYAKETTGYIILFIAIMLITFMFSRIVNLINDISPIWSVCLNALICLFIPNLIIIWIFNKSEEYQYFKVMLKNISKNIKNK